MKTGFNGIASIEYMGFGAYVRVIDGMTFRTRDGDEYELCSKTESDGASARLFNGHINLLPTAAQNGPEAWLHDQHYRTGFVWSGGKKSRRITRKEADIVFAEGLFVRNIIGLDWFIAYYGLRIFGFATWHRYRMADKARAARDNPLA